MKGSAKFSRGMLAAGVVVLAMGGQSHAEENAAARNVLIDKFSKVVLQLPEGDPSKVNVTLRLADLLSERARAAQRTELEAGCTSCNAGREDRVKALRYYQDVLPKLPVDVSGRVLTQVGHLYQMNNEEPKAIGVYEKIIVSGAAPEIVNEAQFSLGEVFFKKRLYEKARGHYAKVLAGSSRSPKGMAAYRLAWCEFYMGNPPQAVAMAEQILNSPQLLTRTAAVEVAQPDAQFQEEVSRDLVTFLAQAKIENGAVAAEKIYKFSPEKARLAHLFALATEFERLGQKKSSIETFRFLQQKENRPIFKLEGQVRLAQLEMELREVTPALNDYDKAIQLWPEVCADKNAPADHCKELGVRLKNFVIDWHKAEKNNPSENLFAAYKLYMSRFPSPDMAFQAALIAKNNKSYAEADKYFAISAVGYASDAAKLEAALLSRIEVAELAKDAAMLNAAWVNYLQTSVQKSKALEVEYQLARAKYEQGDNMAAADALKAVVFSTSVGAADIREKAADLALDALALQKNDQQIEQWAREFAVKLPKKSAEFNQLAAKAGLNKAASLANSSSSAEALAALKSVDVKSLSVDDRIQYLKNRMLLAEKNKSWAEARVTADELLSEKVLSEADRDFALEHKAYLAELILDFKTALAALKLKSKKAPTLRLALMAELAKEDGTTFYRARLAETADAKEKVLIATKLIRESRTADKEWLAQRAVFAKDQNEYAHLALELFARGDSSRGDNKFADLLRKDKTLAGTPAFKALARENLFDQYELVAKDLTAHQLSSDSDRKMVASIKARAALLTKSENIAKSAVTLGDFTSQVLALDLLARESQRFYMDLLGLPVPQGLSSEEETQYMSMLSEQAAPHRNKAEEVGAKVKELWGQSTVINEIQQAYNSETAAIQKILSREIKLLAQVAPAELKGSLEQQLRLPATTTEKAVIANVAHIERAREELRQNPLAVDKVEGLLAVERQLGPSPMVSYLEQRLENLKTHGGIHQVAPMSETSGDKQ